MIRALVLAVAVLPIACGGAAKEPARAAAAAEATDARAPRDVVLTDPADGASVALAPGDRLVVRLVVQLGTGYGWSVVRAPPCLTQEGDPVTERDPDGTEHQRFAFAARDAGAGDLELALVRPWDRAHPSRTVRVVVTVTRQ